jgi:hypothetical protein
VCALVDCIRISINKLIVSGFYSFNSLQNSVFIESNSQYSVVELPAAASNSLSKKILLSLALLSAFSNV